MELIYHLIFIFSNFNKIWNMKVYFYLLVDVQEDNWEISKSKHRFWILFFCWCTWGYFYKYFSYRYSYYSLIYFLLFELNFLFNKYTHVIYYIIKIIIIFIILLK